MFILYMVDRTDLQHLQHLPDYYILREIKRVQYMILTEDKDTAHGIVYYMFILYMVDL